MKTQKEKVSAAIIENQKRLLSFVRSKVGDDALAEEILQEGLLKALKASDQFQDEDKLVSWLYAIIRNTVFDHYRRVNRLTDLPEDLQSEDISLDEQTEICECIEGIISDLKEEYAEIIRRLDLNEESTEKVAEELEISLENLKVRRHRARKKLKQQLEKVCRTCAKHGCLDCGCGD